MTEAVVCCRTGGLPSLCDESRLPRTAGGGAFPNVYRVDRGWVDRARLLHTFLTLWCSLRGSAARRRCPSA
jgi:hypothetical protein